ncbi:MAG: hypothetical protein LBQ88_02675 [Treponema sp.]|jgi:hypothetical protein|nr:hypothetical protein [Treponema sp.]
MMTILQFKVGGEYDYNVTFETGLEKQRIQTNDRPTGNLLSAISSVVVAAIKFFRFESITAQFRQITFSYPENGPDSFVLEFTIKTKDNIYVKHILKTDKLPLTVEDVVSSDTNFQMRVDQNNSLVEKIITLRDEITAYVSGSRAQAELPFEGAEEDGNTEDDASLFDDGDDELDIVAGNISQFNPGDKE